MKRIIATALLLLAFIGFCGKVSADYDGMYAKTTIVIDVNYASDLVFVKDFNNNVWAFFGCEDWEVGDFCSLLMDNNDTEITTDDIILDARYSGWIF